ncbi:uncharacterized protein LOC120084521 [Benincasa hispida]|uniref:uncharacterized protein LOC120084521 n=1 Tax=Benincasa hispida TaxID=102211 RepID=UPI0019017F62|nr:uncharacterized protein LOC120084521 [Benincasa hispida]
MSPFEALYGKGCRSLIWWSEVGERKLVGTELVEMKNETMQKIRARMLVTWSKQKSYIDVRHKDLEFEAGDKVFLKVAPMTGVLSASLSAVHNVFHVSMSRRYVTNPSHMVDFEPLHLNENLSYEEKPIQIIAREVKVLCNREVSLVKVLWRNHRFNEAIWEREDDMRAQYLELLELFQD